MKSRQELLKEFAHNPQGLADYAFALQQQLAEAQRQRAEQEQQLAQAQAIIAELKQ